MHTPILVIGDPAWMHVHWGDTVAAAGHLQPARGVDLSAVWIAGAPRVTQRAGALDRGVARIRDGLAEAAAPLPPAERSLVPALVDGDESRMPPDTATDFQATGLTHLLAVSGSNLTLVLGFVLFVARWCGVRARWLTVVGLAAVVFFVLLARPQPSVLRAAAMGVVGVAGLSAGGRRRGPRVLCVAVISLVLVDPMLARSIGFLLSTLATGAILVFAGPWRDLMARWMPRFVAEAVAVPLAAQVACTPVIAAISGQVSLVAVVANVLAAPAVGPATVAGLLAGLVGTVDTAAGHVAGRLAGVPAWWIVGVAHRAATLRGASMTLPVGFVSVGVLCAGCGVLVLLMPRLLRSRFTCLGVVLALSVAILHPLGRLGWPPDGWIMVACDVGQGDGLVLNAGPGHAVVVDTGPDPRLMDSCLRRLHVDAVPFVVLTHFHADHADGLPGVLDGRVVGEIETSPVLEPADRVAAVRSWARSAGVPQTTAVPGERRRVGDLRWSVLGPLTMPSGAAAVSGDGSVPNNGSVVMLVRVKGHTLLLAGDAEPPEQDDILASGTPLGVDVLKVPHHGSANQDPQFLFASGAPVAVISVGADNDYGHPTPEALAWLRQLGAQVYRTDLDGDVAVVAHGRKLSVVTSKG